MVLGWGAPGCRGGAGRRAGHAWREHDPARTGCGAAGRLRVALTVTQGEV